MKIVLKYMGSGEYIALVPNCDLTDYNIVTAAIRLGITEQQLIDDLCSHGLYQVMNEFYCEICSKPFKSEKTLIKHELKHIEHEITEKDDGSWL